MSDTEDTQDKHRGLIPWQPGQSGNPAGRPRGARNKLGEAFIEKLHADFKDHGEAAIEKVRTDDPSTYLRVVASILPKELNITSSVDLTDEQLDKRIRELASIIQLESGAGRTPAGTAEKTRTH